jgi:hypothetical protein
MEQYFIIKKRQSKSEWEEEEGRSMIEMKRK